MLEQTLKCRSSFIPGSSESHVAALRKAETERDELSRQLTTRQVVLDEQVTRLKDQVRNKPIFHQKQGAYQGLKRS